MSRRVHYYLTLILFYTLLGAGCTGKTPQAVYYTLNSIELDSVSLQTPAVSHDIVIGIDPVKFPDELDRQSIVTRSGQNRMEVNEFHRWGGSLEKSFTRAMVENISILTGTDQVMARPWDRYFIPDIRVALDIRQFDGRLGEYAFLNTTWLVYEKGQKTPAIVRRTVLKEETDDDSYDTLVAAQSMLVTKLCQEISMTLLEMFPAQ